MTAACVVLALTLFAIVGWLEMREQGEPQAGQGNGTFDDDYLVARRRGRRAVHVLMATAGTLILIAGMAGPGRVWIAMWLAVCGVLILVMSLGLLDFYRTNRYLARKLPQLRQQVLDQYPVKQSPVSEEDS